MRSGDRTYKSDCALAGKGGDNRGQSEGVAFRAEKGSTAAADNAASGLGLNDGSRVLNDSRTEEGLKAQY